MGTLAFPIAAAVAINTQQIICGRLNTSPLLAETNKMVTKINAAQAFILMVEHKGKEKEVTLSEICKFSFAHRIVMGKAVLDEREKNATVNALNIALNVQIGESPLIFKSIGKTTKPWIILAVTIVATYNTSPVTLYDWVCNSFTKMVINAQMPIGSSFKIRCAILRIAANKLANKLCSVFLFSAGKLSVEMLRSIAKNTIPGTL